MKKFGYDGKIPRYCCENSWLDSHLIFVNKTGMPTKICFRAYLLQCCFTSVVSVIDITSSGQDVPDSTRTIRDEGYQSSIAFTVAMINVLKS
jgi:hypothetical protein